MDQNTLWQNIWESAQQQAAQAPAASAPTEPSTASGPADTPPSQLPTPSVQSELELALQAALEGDTESLETVLEGAIGEILTGQTTPAMLQASLQTALEAVLKAAAQKAAEAAQKAVEATEKAAEAAVPADPAAVTAASMSSAGDPPASSCGDSFGVLPACAPLANPYVPYQQENPQQYDQAKGLVRGTMFPGLDLPLLGHQNNQTVDTPLGRLMALGFAVGELGLYLDTHPYDDDVLALFRKYADAYASAMTEYQKTYGPLLQWNTGTAGKYDWVDNPWPWDYRREV